MARGKCRQGKAGGMAPSAGMLMEVRRLLDEGAFRASRAQRFCTGAADCCRFRLTGETPHVTLGEAWGPGRRGALLDAPGWSCLRTGAALF